MDGLLTDDLFGIPDTLLVLQVVQGSNVVPLGELRIACNTPHCAAPARQPTRT